jgi:hypothetical protein
MSVTINAKGTSAPFFTIGKNGTTFYRGSVDPSLFYTMRGGDYWFDDFNNSIWVWDGITHIWDAPQLADLTFVGSTIKTTNTDITLQTNGANAKVIFAGDVGPGIITASASQTLYIDPTIGGGGNLVLIANQWPGADGTANQVLTTNGSGILSFTTANRIGSPAPATTATTGHGYIPITTGTPTGVPTAITGYAPIVADSGGSKLWAYINGVWTAPSATSTSTTNITVVDDVASATTHYPVFTGATSGTDATNVSSTKLTWIPSTGTMSVTGAVNVVGAVSATTKNFLINHPTKEGKQLRYGSLEGPENGVYVRGRIKSNIIELPEYWTKLVDPDSITVTLTPIGKHQKLYVDLIENNKVTIGNENIFGGIDCFYVVYGERIDVEKLVVEF